MKKSILGLIYAGTIVIFTIALINMASAAIVIEHFTYSAHALPGQSVTFTFLFKNTGESDVTAIFTGISMPELLTWNTPSSQIRLSPQETKSVTMAATLGKQPPKRFEGFLATEVSPTDGTPRVLPLFLIFVNGIDATSPTPPQQPFTNPSGSSGGGQTSFCSLGSKDTNLTIEKAKLKSTGSKTKWLAGDTVELQVEIANKGSNTLNDVVIEMGLRDSRGVNNVREFTFKEEENYRRDLGDLRSEEEEDTTFTFTVPASLDEGDYRLILKAYMRGQESSVCTEQVSDFNEVSYQTIEVEREDDEGKFIRFDKILFMPNVASCGDNVQLTAHITNIGDEDQNRVNVVLRSAKLRLNVAKEISSGLDEGEDTSITLSFNVPKDAAAEMYNLELNAEYDYKNGAYQMRSEIPSYISLPLALCRSKIADDVNQYSTLNLSSSKPENQKAVFLPSSFFSTQNWILGIGSLVILLLIIIVAITRSVSGSAYPKPSGKKTLYS